MLWAVLHLTLQLALQLILQVLGPGSDSSAIYYVVYVVCPEDLIAWIFLDLCNQFYHLACPA